MESPAGRRSRPAAFVLPQVRTEIGLHQPGAMAFTRTPCGPNSRAQQRVIISQPGLGEAVEQPAVLRLQPAIDVTLMTDPPPRSIIRGTVSRTSRSAALTLISTILSSISSVHRQGRALAEIGGAVVHQDVHRPQPAVRSARTRLSTSSLRPTWHAIGTT